MKRILFACVEQTIHFRLSEDLDRESAVKAVQEEVEKFKAGLEKKRRKFKIIEEVKQPDESIIVKLKKQYNNYECGDYLN